MVPLIPMALPFLPFTNGTIGNEIGTNSKNVTNQWYQRRTPNTRKVIAVKRCMRHSRVLQ